MHSFLDDLRRGLQRCGLSHQRVLIGVSGGADSVALLRGLVAVAAEFSLTPCVAHLNHGLRGRASDNDADWVRHLADALQVPCEIGAAPVGAISVEAGVEETARAARYRFFETVAAKTDCPSLALAHTADDQTETVLHHLLRGTGLAGLRGIPQVRALAAGTRVVRPLLSIRRSQIEAYLTDLSQPYCVDATNTDTSLTRNKLRHIVLPLLREQVNPQVDAAIRRLAEQAADVEAYFCDAALQLLAKCLKDAQPETCRLDVSPLVGQSPHLVRELFRELWRQQQWPCQAMGFEQWNRLVEVLRSRETITLPDRIEARFHSANLLVLRRGSPMASGSGG